MKVHLSETLQAISLTVSAQLLTTYFTNTLDIVPIFIL